MRHVLSATVQNVPGVLAHVSGMLASRGYNIDSLAVGETEDDLKGDEKSEAKENNEAARMWISGLEAVKRKLGISLVYDLSATPFFLRGSGYIEGTLFPWTMSDFSLMDAIECGIVKLPRR